MESAELREAPRPAGGASLSTTRRIGRVRFAEIFNGRQGMDEDYTRAPGSYTAFLFSIGIALDFSRVDPVSARHWTAVIDGVLAPVLLVGILLATSDRAPMVGQPSTISGRIVIGETAVVMFIAATGAYVSEERPVDPLSPRGVPWQQRRAWIRRAFESRGRLWKGSFERSHVTRSVLPQAHRGSALHLARPDPWRAVACRASFTPSSRIRIHT